jgi:formate-dependent nitrite reductase membrane component NrfD
MKIFGIVLVVLGALSLMGNLTGGGRVADPMPQIANIRFWIWLGVILIGILLLWFAG